jgi:hypothetical protein
MTPGNYKVQDTKEIRSESGRTKIKKNCICPVATLSELVEEVVDLVL